MITRFLLSSERALYRAHLLRLSPDDRAMRFCGGLADHAIDDFVEHLDFTKVRVKVAFDGSLNVVAAAHLCLIDADQVEFALSIESAHRNHGAGRALFRSAIIWMRNIGARTALCSGLRDNHPMLNLAISEGMEIRFDAQQFDAQLLLAKPDLDGVVSEILEEQIGWIDFTRKYLWGPNRLSYLREKYRPAS